MASLVHWRAFVSVSLGSSTSQPSAEPARPDEAGSDIGLQASVYAALRVQLPELVAEWSIQWRAVLDGRDGRVEDAGVALDAATVLLDGLTAADEEPGAPITVGLRLGAEAFAQGASLYHTRKALDLLVTMVMYAMETAAASSDTPVGSVTDGIRLAHQIQRRAALLSLAATRGYTQAHGRALREDFRHLRHDLRNPLGTIKSVLALMDDESVPLEARANPNFRAMAKRNVRALEEMIAHRLSDDALPFSPVAKREISLYTIAEDVSQDLRREAERRRVTVLVDASELRGYFASAGLELLLHGTLLAALQE